MTITHTVHAEIDEQLKLLDAMVAQLDLLCEASRQTTTPMCSDCSRERQFTCRKTLNQMVGDLGAFLVGHATYEERMMELLADTPSCQAHIRAHKAAHQGLGRQLGKLAEEVRQKDPLAASKQVWRLMETWLGDHTTLFDRRLISMTQRESPEINLDNKLGDMLDRHVFPNRPTARRSSGTGALQQARNDCRERYESLSPAQRNVFWLVVGGRKNREIAESLLISVNTVKTHRATIFQKMDVTNVVELVKKTDLLRPEEVTIIPKFFLMKRFGLIDSHWPLILLPLFGPHGIVATFLMRQYFLALPKELEEAGRRERLKSRWAALEAVVGDEKRVERIAEDIVKHYEQRTEAIAGKAMIVCMSRRICVAMYKAITKLRPGWHAADDDKGAIKVVMTGSAADEEEWQPHIRNKPRLEALAKRFRTTRTRSVSSSSATCG